MKVASKKQKGRKLQNYTCKKIAEAIGLDCGPDKDVRPTIMGESGADVKLSPKARKLWPLPGIECKAQEAFSIWKAIEQAKAHDKDWIVVFKRNFTKPYVVVDADWFFDLIKIAKLERVV